MLKHEIIFENTDHQPPPFVRFFKAFKKTHIHFCLSLEKIDNMLSADVWSTVTSTPSACNASKKWSIWRVEDVSVFHKYWMKT